MIPSNDVMSSAFGQCAKYARMEHARATRGRDHRASDRRRRSPAPASSPRSRPGVNALQDLRPAAERARRPDVHGRPPPRQAVRASSSRTSLALRHPPDVRRAPAAVRHARVAARPGLPAARPARRRPRAAPARVRHQAGGVGQAAARPRTSSRGDDRRARPRGVARSATVRGAARRAAPALRAAARPARDRRHRALVGRRDPAHRDDLAVQARLGSRPRRGGAPARGDRSSGSAA